MLEHARWSRESERILGLIRAFQRVLGVTNRELEERLGLSTSYLSRLFNRKIALRYDHVLAIVTGLGLRLDEFFRSAYPPADREPSEAARKIHSVFAIEEPEDRA